MVGGDIAGGPDGTPLGDPRHGNRHVWRGWGGDEAEVRTLIQQVQTGAAGHGRADERRDQKRQDGQRHERLKSVADRRTALARSRSVGGIDDREGHARRRRRCRQLPDRPGIADHPGDRDTAGRAGLEVILRHERLVLGHREIERRGRGEHRLLVHVHRPAPSGARSSRSRTRARYNSTRVAPSLRPRARPISGPLNPCPASSSATRASGFMRPRA